MQTPDSIAAFPSVIRGQSSGPAVGASSAMTYRVLVNFPDGPREVTGIAPAKERYPDTLDVRAIKAGTFAWVGMVHGELQLDARELPFFRECAGAAVQMPNLLAQIMAMSEDEKSLVRKALGL